MIMKKVLLTALMLTTFTSATAFANSAGPSTTKDDALQNAIKNDVESFVKTAYVPYYTINSTKLTVRNYTLQNNVLTAQVDISLTKTLKAKTVDDVPYVKGLKKKLSDLKIAKAANVTDAEQVVNDKSKEIGTYIGVAQEQNDSFRITANVVNDKLDLKNAKLEFLDFLDWVPATAFIPATDATISKHGEDDLTDAITVNKKNVMKANTNSAGVITPQSIIIQYDRLAARDYANTWTSEVPNGFNESKWNPGYAHHTESGGVDCANYVSQAISAGGIPVDTTWKPEAIAWVNTGQSISNGLKQYMVDTKGYFYQTTKSGVSAGGWIFETNGSHVMFVVANDGVTMLFSAHTNDRLKASFANFGSTFNYYYISASYAIN